ncbi:unnamed protein product (macronuclear) [Paramecium tetraurelia]|uniref:BZIP domain-containing protein n=1 Tax=Paramecium tetraurelia TaxID=5888 RepID=A0BP30_PARTE|nr:uncharacterized protein GSPATT00005046001 [Paramecium tetraurelia]CAK60297.1 unnamed protein product [Paramecium tetraurelia]|eukprot:XP_001427695.1 hypothetical protein (macronuclear) [Paramecium tetraurelia strain d4-2]
MQDDRVRYMYDFYFIKGILCILNIERIFLKTWMLCVLLWQLSWTDWYKKTICLKRKSKEISNLRVDRLNYEKQIGDLMNRLQQLMAENDMLKRDNDKLKAQLNSTNQRAQQLEGQVKDFQQEIQLVSNKLEDITGGDGGKSNSMIFYFRF